jgi:fused signal recognition particle receptor
MFGALKKLKEGLAKTRGSFVQSLRSAVTGGAKLDESLLETIEETLLAGDVGVPATERIVSALREGARSGRVRNSEDAWALIREEALALLTPSSGAAQGPTMSRSGVVDRRPPNAQSGSGSVAESGRRDLRASEAASARSERPPSATSSVPAPRPHVILVIGVNGVGKTTTIGKIATRLARDGRRVLLGAGDTFRAAASEQLDLWAERAGVEIVRQERGADPASVVFDAYARAKSRGFDTLIIDTAGRLHTKSNLIEELKKVVRVLAKQDASLPDEVLLVLDATTGQNALAQARTFVGAVGVTGLVVTKLDGTSKGGVLLALTEELSIPVRYIGLGEGQEDLQDFDPEAFVDALLEEGVAS